MGGFCAATYKRGIDFINIPTTLLAMVDAAIGGKTGVDLGFFKNQVGVFAFPRAVIIDPAFLNTLPYDELKNGYAEIIKHALIADNSLWLTLQKDGFNQVSNLIEKSMVIKTEIVSKDPYEKDRRKLLNFGHTVGHALEMLSQEPTGRQLAHGEAVAEGIIAESYISVKMTGLPTAEADQIKHFIRRFFPVPTFYKSNFEAVYELMLNDKKNVNGALKMTLLKSIGKGIINISVSKKIIMECLKASLMP
ncbi:MAG: 3-dehydroquinate synthase [Bacteroidetes bacterium ADurb.Bin408]|nr:MAG: 3-dehydroquinate synthase [Bacteroidetes bacterium ADurb.Bin408]